MGVFLEMLSSNKDNTTLLKVEVNACAVLLKARNDVKNRSRFPSLLNFAQQLGCNFIFLT